MKRALLFAINDYAGSANDLRGCINDAIQWKLVLESFGFEVKVLVDHQVTCINFVDQVESLFQKSKKGDILFIGYSGHGTQVPDRSGDEIDGYDEALYLFDGPLIDDTTNGLFQQKPEGSLLVAAFDSCFSGTGTRDYDDLNGTRFHPLGGEGIYENRSVRKRGIIRSDIDMIYLSGCQEKQTSADAFIGNDYHGAFSYFAANRRIMAGNTFKGWHKDYMKCLRVKGFEQVPCIEGKPELFRLPVFPDNISF